jgi:hypothetical protein
MNISHGHHVVKIKIYKTAVSLVVCMDMKLVCILEART